MLVDKSVTIASLVEAKQQGRKTAAVSCYDYTTARLVAAGGAEMILVGDSAAQIMLGHDSTLPATMDFMVAITAAVRRAAPNVCLAADMPFLSYQVSIPDAITNAGRFVKEAGAQLIKIEATAAQLGVIKAVSDAGMAVMAHIGIRPQSITKSGRLRAEGTTADVAYDLIALAEAMAGAGACAILLEGTAREVAKIITQRLSVPVIGCGSGPDCDAQILIVSDILGLSHGPVPKFSKSYADVASITTQGITSYVKEVHTEYFPDDKHCYHMKEGHLESLKQMLQTLNP